MSEVPVPELEELLLAACLLLVPAAVSLSLRLQLEGRLLVASLRAVLQLTALGLVLRWVFATERWYVVIAILIAMMTVASRAAVKRSGARVPRIFWLSFLVCVLTTSAVTFTVTAGVLAISPWYAPRYLLPLAGMLLGNGLNGTSLALGRLLRDLRQNRARIEARLCLGAPLWLALRPELREAVRVGMVPILNSMTVVGLVSLPGMMTGQILAGVDPLAAVAYQLLILFMIAAATAACVVTLCLGVYRVLRHPAERLRWEQIEIE